MNVPLRLFIHPRARPRALTADCGGDCGCASCRSAKPFELRLHDDRRRSKDAEWKESEHPRGQPGNAGQFGSGGAAGGKKEKQKLKMPQFGLTPTPSSSSHQPPKAEPEGAEYFEKNWWKSGSVGGHSQPTPEMIATYIEAYESLAKGTKPPAPPKPAKPLEPAKMKKVGGQLGTNVGGVYENKAGEKFYIKAGKSAAHVKNELIAGTLYNLAGAKTLKYVPVEGGKHIGTEWQDKDKDTAIEFNAAELKKAQQDFAVHAWTANWDAAGLDYDNQAIINGEPTSVDLGGALDYRALGEPKGKMFGTSVGEWDTLRDKTKNKQSAYLFGGMSQAELRESARKVTEIPDASIKAAILAGGGDPDLADKMIARKRDIAKRAGLKAKDEAKFEESKHPRDPAGKFTAGAGAAPGGEGEQKTFKSKKEHAGHLLEQGITMPEMLKALGWPSISMPAMAKSLGMKLEKIKEGGVTKYKGVKMTPQELAIAKAEAAKAKMEKAMKPAEPPPPAAAPAPPPAAPPPPPSSFGPPTEAELEKAKKSATLQPQYLGIPDLPQTPAIMNEIAKFNGTYAGVNVATKEGLTAKVNAFKALKAKVTSMLPAEKQKQIAHQKELQAKVEAQMKAAEAKAKEEAAQHLKQLEGTMRELGLDADQADVVQTLADLMGTPIKTLTKEFGKYQNEAKGKGLALNGFEYAMIKSYMGSGYGALNAQLRQPSWTHKMHVMAKVINKGLAKMPIYTGDTLMRGTTLSQEQKAAYKVGHVVEERAFTSTMKPEVGTGFSGNTKYTITKPKTARDLTSIYQGEGEVLFPAKTMFKVTKVENLSGHTHIHMEEVDPFF